LMEALKSVLTSVPASTKGVRLDLAIEFPGGKDLWCDFTGIHATSTSTSKKLTKWLNEANIADYVSAGVVANNPTARTASPAVVAAIVAKDARYKLMLELASQQKRNRRREYEPTFVAAVITHTGELSQGMITLIERITAEAAKNFRRSELTLGLSKKRFTAAFRTRLKDALMATNARGFGRALYGAGNPMPGHTCSPADDLLLPNWDQHNY
jgi:hypothetical protein